MAQIEITENQYNTTCDVYGCGNIAVHVIGKVGEGQAQKALYCEECLQGIINQAPLEMIFNRPELIDEEVESEITITSLEDEEVGKALEVEIADLSLMKFQELKELATARGIIVPFGTSKDQLIELLKGE